MQELHQAIIREVIFELELRACPIPINQEHYYERMEQTPEFKILKKMVGKESVRRMSMAFIYYILSIFEDEETVCEYYQTFAGRTIQQMTELQSRFHSLENMIFA